MAAVLRRVAAGERVRVTVRGRVVADLVPAEARPRTMTAEAFEAALARAAADPGLRLDLGRALPDTTDDVTLP